MHRFPLPPSANRYWRYARGKVYATDEAKSYKHTVAMLARVDGAKQITGPVALTVAVYRARKAGDLDNYLKCLIDALQGVYYRNDAQIVRIVATRHDDKHDPHVEVTVTSHRGKV